ncbi:MULTISPECIES: hypothetical protein [unclassified Micromonospora]|uniref:hypothetical protein n=1 Tax=unclassified Micromonospora TaxID=2617518 RepID=UPI003A87A99F
MSIFLSDGENAWAADPAPGTNQQELTAAQLEQVMLEALTSPGPPRWPHWRDI